METNLIAEALKFMALGMGIVFLFLIVMVYALKLQAKIIAKYFSKEEKPKVVKPTRTTGAEKSNETAKIAAVVAAVQHHKNLKG